MPDGRLARTRQAYQPDPSQYMVKFDWHSVIEGVGMQTSGMTPKTGFNKPKKSAKGKKGSK